MSGAWNQTVELGKSTLEEASIMDQFNYSLTRIIEDSYIVICHACGSKQCFKHQVKWHEGFTCDQWDEHIQSTTKNENMTEKWISTETKPCPAENCGRRVCPA